MAEDRATPPPPGPTSAARLWDLRRDRHAFPLAFVLQQYERYMAKYINDFYKAADVTYPRNNNNNEKRPISWRRLHLFLESPNRLPALEQRIRDDGYTFRYGHRDIETNPGFFWFWGTREKIVGYLIAESTEEVEDDVQHDGFTVAKV